MPLLKSLTLRYLDNVLGEKAFLGTPVILQDRCVGVISLIAVTHEQQEHISDNLREFSDYVRHISTIFVSKQL